MKSTGVLRRIDELGRIVIPKEIRRNLKIKDGESLEIFIDDNSVVLKKYSDMRDLHDIAQNCSDSFYDVINKDILITDLDRVIAASGPMKKRYLNKEISSFVTDTIKNRSIDDSINNVEIVEGITEDNEFVISYVVVSGDAVGSVIILSDTKISDVVRKTSDFIAKFLGKHLE